MILAAHQPNFLPNLAYFKKMLMSDIFVIITNIQFEKHEGWQQRHKIPGPSNDIWLTVPVLGSQTQLIRDVKINNSINWRKKHSRTLDLLYKNKAGNNFIKEFDDIYLKYWERLADINIAMILAIKDILQIRTPVVIDEEVSGVKHNLLINVCKKYNADTFLSGHGAKSYLSTEKLAEIEEHKLSHVYVKKDLSSMYPYSTIHYLLSEGREFVSGIIK